MEEGKFLLMMDELLEVEPGTVKASDTLGSLGGLTSLAVIGLMALVDEHFNMRLQPKQLIECKTVTDIMNLLGDRIIRQASA